MTITTTSPVDVNEQFQAEQRGRIDSQRQWAAEVGARAEQRLAAFRERVDAGEMSEGPTGTFTALQGWDKGEQWTVRTNVAGQLMILPQHGLATDQAGKASLYTRVPFWHDLGHVVPEGLSSVGSVLDFAGLNYRVIKEQAKRLTAAGTVSPVAGHHWTVREGTDQVLGHVGDRYTVIQNVDQFAFLQELVDTTAGTDTPVIWETAGQLESGRVFTTLRLGEDIIIDVDGYQDAIRPFLSALNSHDGSTQFTLTVSPWRIGCGNTERFNMRDAVTRWSTPHTANAQRRIDEARRTLRLTSAYFEQWAAEQTALATAAVKVDEFAAFAAEFNDEFWPMPKVDEGGQQSVRAINGRARRIDAMVAKFEANSVTLSRTAYAAERAMTEWLDHDAGIRVPKSMTEAMARATKVIEGDNDTRKSYVHEKLMLRVR